MVCYDIVDDIVEGVVKDIVDDAIDDIVQGRPFCSQEATRTTILNKTGNETPMKDRRENDA